MFNVQPAFANAPVRQALNVQRSIPWRMSNLRCEHQLRRIAMPTLRNTKWRDELVSFPLSSVLN